MTTRGPVCLVTPQRADEAPCQRRCFRALHTNISEEPVKDSLVKWVMSLQLCGWRRVSQACCGNCHHLTALLGFAMSSVSCHQLPLCPSGAASTPRMKGRPCGPSHLNCLSRSRPRGQRTRPAGPSCLDLGWRRVLGDDELPVGVLKISMVVC